ncbi:MAG TPA: DedA family protein [Candidatus Paceibacterota bacterium]|nr:DedA family protein [Candidatus Paceibacterota bacterium]
MQEFLQSIQAHFPMFEQYKYVFLLLGATLESLNMIILAGFLASIGSVAAVPAFLIALAGDFLNGYMWYLVGYLGGAKPVDKWGRKDPKSRRVVETVERYFLRYSGRAIIFTKLTWSLTIATLIMAGSFRYNFRKFSLYNFIGAIGWTCVTFFIGYVFGQGYRSFAIVNNFSLIALFLGGAIILVYGLKVILKSKFIQSLWAMERLRELGDKLRDTIDKMMS